MMSFGSSHVYKYDLSDEESLSETEYDAGLNLSCDSDGSDSDEDDKVPTTRCMDAAMSSSLKQPKAKRRSLRSLGGESSAAFERNCSVPPLPRAPAAAGGGGGLRGGINRLFRRLSGSRSRSEEQDDEQVDASRASRALKPKSAHHRGQRRYRRADTNVVTLRLESLIKPSHMHTGDAERCANCRVVLSHLSKLKDTAQAEDKVWQCEFCAHTNVLDLMPEEVPKTDDITYMLEPAASTAAAGSSGVDESLVVFCVDISGSMCVTTEVPGRVNLRGSHLEQLQSLNTERESQFLPGQRRNVTYVSRLQGMQGAVDHQLEAMKKEHPNRRVALIAFNDEVVIYGDGSTEPIHLAQHRLTAKEDLVNLGSEAALPKPIKDTRKMLGDKIFDLEEGGPTALGPAVLFSVALACQVPGSKVIVCTDGKANVGLGALDAQDLEAATTFYEEVSTLAVAKGVSVSVTSIKGTDCRMEELGRVADATGGQVNIVDPLRLTEEFGSILADPVIATNVTATFITHKGLYIREEGATDNKISRYIGNVTLNSEVTFEFGMKERPKKPSKTKDVEMKDIQEDTAETEVDMTDTKGTKKQVEENPDVPAPAEAGGSSTPAVDTLRDLTELPFQLQVTYTDLEGAKALRVVTQAKPITEQREVAEQYMNVEVLGVHAAKRSANLAQDGDYDAARLNAHTSNILVKKYIKKNRGDEKSRAAHRGIFCNIQGLEQQLQQQQQTEMGVYGNNLDMEDCLVQADNAEYAATSAAFMSVKKKKKEMRSRDRDDQLATKAYQLKNAKWRGK